MLFLVFGVFSERDCSGVVEDELLRRACATREAMAYDAGTDKCRCFGCPVGATLNTADLTCSCNVDESVAMYDAESRLCKCTNSQMYYYNGECVSCPAGTTVLPYVQTCSCPSENYVYDPTTRECGCPYVLYGSTCQVCPAGSEMSRNTCACDNELTEYSPTHNLCICKDGYVLRNGQCSPCPEGASSTSNRQACICSVDQMVYDYESNTCACGDNMYYDAGIGCVSCSDNCPLNAEKTSCEPLTHYVYDEITGACSCDESSFEVAGSCESCPEDATLVSGMISSATARCACKAAETQEYDAENNQCKCKNVGEAKIDGVCTACPENSSPSDDQQDCACVEPNAFFDRKEQKCVVCGAHSTPNVKL